MSISVSLKKAIEAQNILGIKLAVSKQWCPTLRNFSDKWHLVQCRKCNGLGINKVDGEWCAQCQGKGVEKLSPKAIRRAVKKMESEK